MNEHSIEREIDSGKEFFIFKTKNKKVYLNSTFSPEKESEKFVNQVYPDKLNIIIGIGNGAIVKQLFNRRFAQCLIIEPFENIKLDEKIGELIKGQKNISFYYYKDITPLIINEYIKKFLGLEVNIVIHPNYEKTDITLLNEVIKMIKDGSVMLQVNRNTEKYFKKDWIIEPLLNLKYTLSFPSISDYHNRFDGETAFLIASGPSLKENLSFIKEMENRAHIFAVGSALNGLLSNDIIPDYVTVIDSSIKNYTAHFEGVNYNGPLIVSGMVNSNILENHNGPTILANLNIDSITPFFREDVPTFPSVPSVSVFTLQILYYLGFSTVYLIGQDLALLDGKYYAKDIKVHMGSNTFEPHLYVENNKGTKVGTLYSLYAHLQSFNDLVGLFDQRKIEIYNLSERGAKIKGVDYLAKDSIIIDQEKKEIKFVQTFENKNNLIEIKKFINNIKEVQIKVFQILNRLKKINKNAISKNDLKKVLILFKELRSQNIIEGIFLKQLSFYVQKINNKFEYTFEKEIISNQDRLEMVKDIISLVEEVEKYLNEILNDEKIKRYLK